MLHLLHEGQSPAELLALAQGCRACEVQLRYQAAKLAAKISQLRELAEAYERLALTHVVTPDEARKSAVLQRLNSMSLEQLLNLAQPPKAQKGRRK